MYRLRLNAFKTKFCKEIYCICGETISVDHLLLHCNEIKKILPSNQIKQMLDNAPLTIELI